MVNSQKSLLAPKTMKWEGTKKKKIKNGSV